MPSDEEVEAATKAMKGALWARLPDWTDADFKESARAILEAAEKLRNPPATGWELDQRDAARSPSEGANYILTPRLICFT